MEMATWGFSEKFARFRAARGTKGTGNIGSGATRDASDRTEVALAALRKQSEHIVDF